jgi:hypothetical protein
VTSFCPACGEKPLSPGDLTLRGLFGLVFEAFSNIDGRLLRRTWSLAISRRPAEYWIVAAADGWTGGTAVLSPLADDVASVLLISACAIYLFFAIGTVFEVRGISRVVRTVGLTVAVASVFMAYRFLLLPMTLFST